MPNSKQLHIIATNPRAHLDFMTRGKLPQGKAPEGPLVDLLKKISPRDQNLIVGLTVDDRLGYTGSRQFHTAAQAMRWIHPDAEVFGSFPADSWRNKRFQSVLHIEDLIDCAARAPDNLADKYPGLCKPKKMPKP